LELEPSKIRGKQGGRVNGFHVNNPHKKKLKSPKNCEQSVSKPLFTDFVILKLLECHLFTLISGILINFHNSSLPVELKLEILDQHNTLDIKHTQTSSFMESQSFMMVLKTFCPDSNIGYIFPLIFLIEN
jgi:hypothetical protein